ncbi:short-chain dehydrogenase [Seiridium cupressi]
MSTSWTLGPPKESPGKRFLRSQFLSPAQWPSNETNLDGKVAIVTGATSGLGLEASRQLLSLGLTGLIIAVRSTEKGEKVAAEFRSKFPKANIQVWSLEMESYESILAFARRSEAELSRLDIAILNAGIQALQFSLVPETKHEKLIQVNYLSTMLLAILLLPVLKAKSPPGEPGRLTIVSSGTARGSQISSPPGSPILSILDDKSAPWDPVARYAVSKLLGHLFIINLIRCIDAEDVVVNLADPGLVKDTNLQGGGSAPFLITVFFYCMKALLGRTLQIGGSTYVDASVVKGKESHGCYVADWKISQFAAFVYTAEGEAAREQLWEETMAEFNPYESNDASSVSEEHKHLLNDRDPNFGTSTVKLAEAQEAAADRYGLAWRLYDMTVSERTVRARVSLYLHMSAGLQVGPERDYSQFLGCLSLGPPAPSDRPLPTVWRVELPWYGGVAPSQLVRPTEWERLMHPYVLLHQDWTQHSPTIFALLGCLASDAGDSGIGRATEVMDMLTRAVINEHRVSILLRCLVWPNNNDSFLAFLIAMLFLYHSHTQVCHSLYYVSSEWVSFP